MEQIRNFMEVVVENAMKSVLEDINACTCKKCLLDISAIALNDLPPRYVVSEKGELYSKIDALKQQFEVDVISAITKAAVIVKRKPRH